MKKNTKIFIEKTIDNSNTVMNNMKDREWSDIDEMVYYSALNINMVLIAILEIENK